jgi:hypothetical protein
VADGREQGKKNVVVKGEEEKRRKREEVWIVR